MKTFRRIAPSIAVVAAWTAMTAFPSLEGPGAVPKVGDKAREFRLTALDGGQVTLSGELTRGPVALVLLRGWPGYQCPFCTRQFGDFLAHEKDFCAAGASVVWVYPGPPEEVLRRAHEFTADRPLPACFRFVIDPDYAFTVAYGLRWDAPGETSYPSTFVIDRASVIRYAHVSRTHGGRAEAADVLRALAAGAKRNRTDASPRAEGRN